MGICGSCESEEAKFKKAQAKKRADEAYRIAYEADMRKAEADKSYGEENEKKRKMEELEIHAKQLFHKVKITQDEVTAMYDQINCLLKDKKEEDAEALAKHVVAREAYLVELRTQMSFLIEQANELEMGQLSVDLKKRMDGINEQLKTQVRYCKELTEMLLQNRELVSQNEYARIKNLGLMDNDRKAYKVADVLKKAKEGNY